MKFAFWVFSVFSFSLFNSIAMLSVLEQNYRFNPKIRFSKDNGIWWNNNEMADNMQLLTHSDSHELFELASIAERDYSYSNYFKVPYNYPINKKQKPIPCPKIFNPVCATFGGVKSTFINECLVNAENVKTRKNWKIFSYGICDEDFSIPILPKILRRNERTIIPQSNYLNSIKSQMDLGNYVTYINAPASFQTEIISSQNSEEIIRSIEKTKSKNSKVDNFFQKHIFTYSPQGSLTFPQHTHNHDFNNIWKFFEDRQTPPHQIKPKTQNTNLEFSPEDSPLQIKYSTSNNNHFINSQNCNLGNMPICARYGENTQTFKDICKLKLHNKITGQDWEIAHEGECRNCVLDCPRNFEPICASKNGIQYTFQNECFLKSLNCMSIRSTWIFIKHGICEGLKGQNIKDKYEDIKPGFRFKSNYMKPFTITSKIEEFHSTTNTIFETTTEKPTYKEVTEEKIETSSKGIEFILITTTESSTNTKIMQEIVETNSKETKIEEDAKSTTTKFMNS